MSSQEICSYSLITLCICPLLYHDLIRTGVFSKQNAIQMENSFREYHITKKKKKSAAIASAYWVI